MQESNTNSRVRLWSIQSKFTLVISAVTVIVLLVNIFLLSNINNITQEIPKLYESNIELNLLSQSLDHVQSALTDYQTIPSSRHLTTYQEGVEELSYYRDRLSENISSRPTSLAEKNLRNMLETYISCLNQAIREEEGNDYEKAGRLYSYISDLIFRLNNDRFMENGENYTTISIYMKIIEILSSISYLLIAVLGILLVTLMSSTITTPLRHLARAAEEVTHGNFKVRLEKSRSRDEVDVVTDAFRTMISSIQDYIVLLRRNMETEQEMKQKEQEMKEKALLMDAQLKDAQLKYLQAQIHPHFLFNTLNAGAQLAMMEGADRAYEYIQQVAAFFRYNIGKNDDVSLKEEIEMVDTYMYILNVRFAGDIGYEKEIDSRFLDLRLPGMTLQPLVENCVSHGIRNITWDAMISLSVYQAGDKICISIRDNGVGMTPERIEEILSAKEASALSEGESNGIGMFNVRNRLELMYGQTEMMDILSEGPGKGTEIILYIPMEEPEHV